MFAMRSDAMVRCHWILNWILKMKIISSPRDATKRNTAKTRSFSADNWATALLGGVYNLRPSIGTYSVPR